MYSVPFSSLTFGNYPLFLRHLPRSMASMVSATSPTSLQIRFRHRCRGSFIRVQFRAANRRIRQIYAAGAPASGGGKRSSWNGPDASPDTFAGWSNSESDSDSGDPNKKGGYGGIWGAGLAGVFFAAGVTFASISLRNKTTSVKQQMEPLTTDQEVLLTSDDQGNESTYLLPDEESNFECNSNCGTGINKESLPPAETNGNSIEGGLDMVEILETPLVENSKSTDNSVEAIHNASDQVDSQIWPNSDINLVPSDCNPSSPELSAHEVLDLASSFKDTSSSIQDLDIRYDVNPGTDNHVELSLDLTNHPTDYQEGNINKKKAVDSELSVDFSSEFEGQIPIEPLSTILESSNTVGLGNRDAGKTATSVLKEEDIECGGKDGTIYESNFDEKETAQLPNKIIDSSDEHKLDENTRIQSVFLSVSELELSGKEPDISSYSEIDRSLPFESVLSERTFSYAGIPAPSIVSAAILQVPPGKVLVPAVVDQVQGQALAALQVLKVIEADVIPGDLCTRREYARWLVSASSALSRNTVSKVYPAMYIENVTELAFDDVTPEDPDFPYIQGLAESGIISSKLSIADVNGSFNGQHESFFFYPESPLSRQDLVSWKMALEKRQLPEVDRNHLYKCSGYIDTDKINPDAWPALVADLSSGEQGITALAFGYTRLFQPNKPVTKAQAAIALATGDAAEVVGEELTRIEAESLAENVVNAHTALIAQVEKDLNASFEQELAKEREKIYSIEKLAEETTMELERLRAEREEENIALIKGRAAVESEMEVLSRLRRDVEEQLQDLLSNKVKISFERDRINKLQKETETENQVIVQLQYELEVERKALSMARAWAEEEAKRAREQARTLEEARGRWEMHGLKVVVDEDLQDAASAGTTWMTAGEQQIPVVETISRAERLVTKLRPMVAEVKLKSSNLVKKIIERLIALITALKQWLSEAPNRAMVLGVTIRTKACRSVEELRETAAGMKASAGEKARRVAEDCKESVDKITQKFKT